MPGDVFHVDISGTKYNASYDVNFFALHPENYEESTYTSGYRETKVRKIKVSGISHKIAAGRSIKLKAKVFPAHASYQRIRWYSSNKAVATVSQSGKVRVKKGSGGKTVIIRAVARDGSKKYGVWKIHSMRGVVKKIKVKAKKKTLKSGKTMKLKAIVKASKGANKKVKWTSSNKRYANITSAGKLTAYKAGKGKKVIITATSTDGSNKKKSIKIHIK